MRSFPVVVCGTILLLASPVASFGQSDAKNGEPIQSTTTLADELHDVTPTPFEGDELNSGSLSLAIDDVAPTAHPLILAPTAFTPDGDGLNDKYFPRFLGLELRQCRFQVFDRWGHLLFTTSTPNDGWDGTLNRAGAALPQGVYVWFIEAQTIDSEEKMSFAGSVTLMR